MPPPPRTIREVELKLELSDADRRDLARHPYLLEITEGRASTRTLHSVYYDTRELALWKAGLVLRVRRIGRRRILGVKTRGSERGGLSARDECEVPVPTTLGPSGLVAAIPDDRLRRAVKRAVAGAPLAPRVETEVRRTTRLLRYGNASLELALDVGHTRASRRRLPICEIEIELRRGRTRAVYDLALRLSRDVLLRPAPHGKAERGFRALLGEETSGSRARPPALRRRATTGEAIEGALGECLRHIAANQVAIERGRGPEGVHQMRVGARRLRSSLRLFRDQLPAREAATLSGELRWLARVLGEARDLDVFLDELLAPIARRRRGDAGIAALREAAQHERRRAYAEVRRVLTSPRYAALLLRLGRFVDGGGYRSAASEALDRPARPLARRLLRRRAAAVSRLGERIDTLSTGELHQLRIRTKRLRYATELLAPLLDPGNARRASRRLAKLQDVLGHLNDQTTAEALLGRVRPRTPDVDVSRAEGFVSGFAARSAAVHREQVGRAWRRFAKLGAFWD